LARSLLPVTALAYEAYLPGKDTISAPDLPETVRLERCPLGERVILDNGIGTVLPAPGQSIYVESVTSDGSQELEVARYRVGTVELKYIGDESARCKPEIGTAASDQGGCSDDAYDHRDHNGYVDLRWYFNPRTTPKELLRKGALLTQDCNPFLYRLPA
jgi:hypothetical protein